MKVSKEDICILLYLQGAQAQHVLIRDYTLLPANHTCIHRWNMKYASLYSTATQHHRTSDGTHGANVSHPWCWNRQLDSNVQALRQCPKFKCSHIATFEALRP